jgi:hypothetical protein
MDARKQNPASGAQEGPALAPVEVFTAGDVSAAVFAREQSVRGGTRTFYSVSFSRSYRDAEGNRQYVKTFDADGLDRVVEVARQADEYVRSLTRPK